MMKKLLALVFLMLIISVIKAQVSKTINVSTTGTLSTLLSETEKSTIANLIITGNIDARDFKCMRDEMSALSVLDISQATILKYEGVDGTYTFQQMSYPENEIPTFAFTVGPPPCEFDYCISKLSSIKFPSTLNSIGTYAFGYCKQLTQLTLPSSLKTINRYAFYNCINLANINALNPTPPIVNDNTFDNVSATVHVTSNSALLEYKANTSWNHFTIILDSTLNTSTNKINAESNRIYVYPNPVKDQLKIDFIDGSTFEILNLMGQIVYTGNLNNSNIVQTSNFSSGVYLIKFNAGKSLEYKKIIKK